MPPDQLRPDHNVDFPRAGGWRYIVGTAKNSLRQFERELRPEAAECGERVERAIVPARLDTDLLSSLFKSDSRA